MNWSERLQGFIERHTRWQQAEVIQKHGNTLCLVVTPRTTVRVFGRGATGDYLSVYTHYKLNSAKSRGLFSNKNTGNVTVITGSPKALQYELDQFQRRSRHGEQLVLFTDFDQNNVPEVEYQSVEEHVMTESSPIIIERDNPLIHIDAHVPPGTTVIIKVVADPTPDDTPSADV